MTSKRQWTLKNALGYLITPLMLISIGFFTNLLQEYWKQWWPGMTAALLFAVGLLLLLIVALTYISLKKNQLQQHDETLSLSSRQTMPLLWNNFFVVLLAILLGSVIAVTGNLLLPVLKNAFDQQGMSYVLFVVIVLLAIADYFSYRRSSAGHWLLAGLAAFVCCFWQPVLANTLLLTVMTLYSLKLFYLISRHLIRPYNKLVGQTLSPKTHLMLFLSPLADPYLSSPDAAENPHPLVRTIESNKTKWQSMEKNMRSDLSWEMAYRAIHSQLVLPGGARSRLQFIIVALSADSRRQDDSVQKGSAGMITDFVEGLRHLLTLWNVQQAPRILLLLREPNSASKFCLEQYQQGQKYQQRGINSSSFEETSAAVFSAISQLISERVAESDIVIDITSWQKNTSVAGALVATVTDVHNQYIDTNSKEITSYDFTFNDFTKLT